MNEFFKKITEIKARIPEATKRLPGIAKVEGLRFIADNFKNEGFEVEKGRHKVWQRKKKGSKKDLVGEKRGGKLKRSWQKGASATTSQAVFSSGLPYAEVHNEGLLAGKPPGFQMPRRQMIGPSGALDKRISDKFDSIAEDVFYK